AVERMAEIMSMCDRNNPVYDQVTSFSVALYALGFCDCPDFISFQDVSAGEAAELLCTHFSEVDPDEIPEDYHLIRSKERYLLVIGDPLFPIHFAVIADKRAERPYFSKLPFFGAGYDSLDELVTEFVGIDGVTREDFHFFRKNRPGRIPSSSLGKIYIVRD
ncbi:MAG: hypothetical protein ACLFPD_06060, partial [Desulfosudaceae bacterium]